MSACLNADVFPLNLIYKTNIFNGTSLAINDVNQLTILVTFNYLFFS